jgi:hypothetical protein
MVVRDALELMYVFNFKVEKAGEGGEVEKKEMDK